MVGCADVRPRHRDPGSGGGRVRARAARRWRPGRRVDDRRGRRVGGRSDDGRAGGDRDDQRHDERHERRARLRRTAVRDLVRQRGRAGLPAGGRVPRRVPGQHHGRGADGLRRGAAGDRRLRGDAGARLHVLPVQRVRPGVRPVRRVLLRRLRRARGGPHVELRSGRVRLGRSVLLRPRPRDEVPRGRRSAVHVQRRRGRGQHVRAGRRPRAGRVRRRLSTFRGCCAEVFVAALVQ
jgi:hypothetical protein